MMRMFKFLMFAGAVFLLTIAAFAVFAEETPPNNLGPFSQIAPRNHAVITHPDGLTSTLWTSSQNAVMYRFELYRVERQADDEVDDSPNANMPAVFGVMEGDGDVGEIKVIEQSKLVYDANIKATDICANGFCTFPVDAEMRSVLHEGVFKWIVKAFGAEIDPVDNNALATGGTDAHGLLALNAPFFFAIDAGDPGIPGFPGPFILYRPRNGAIFESPQGLTVAAWTRSAGAISYNFKLNRRDDQFTEIADLRFDADVICGDARCRIDITPEIQNQLTDGIYSWRVFASDGHEIRRARNSPSYFLIDTDGSILPGTLNWIAPTGILTDTLGNPTYVWQVYEGATFYELYLARTNFLRHPIFYGSIEAARICDVDVCEVDLTTLDNGGFSWLSNGDYTAYARPSNGEWSGPFNFIVRVPRPDVVTNLMALTTTRPTISWTLEGGATLSSWFRVYVAKPEHLAVPSYDKWYSRAQACGTLDSTMCSVQIDVINGDYHAYVQNWSPGGFAEGGIAGTGFVGPAEFSLHLPRPNPATDLTVVSTNPLILTWTGDANASWHQVWVGTRAPHFATRHHRWILASELGCENGGTCTLTLGAPDIGNGLYTWFVMSAGPGGFSISDLFGWTQGGDFAIDVP